MVVVDPKGECFCYTHAFLEREGYEIVTLDFTDPARSSRYNFLQPCIDAANLGDMPKAIEAARDIATILVAENSHTEALWTEGARSVLMTSILACVVDNQNHPEFQNLANAREFMSKMCTPTGKKGRVALSFYIEKLPDDHPIKLSDAITNIATEKMRGSFYTQALVALDRFADPHIHAMTAATDFDIDATGKRKRAIFIILPDEKKTYHPLAALFVTQHYQSMVAVAKQEGGRLQRRVQFFCDEFGNFVKIPDFDTLLTVAGGRGMRFHLALQDTNQLDEKYNEKIGRTIRSNCETWVYLQSDENRTLQEISDKCGKYTVKTPSISGSSGGHSSASYSLTGRPLLMSDEVKRIQRPYQLVTSRSDPAVLYSPDVSQTIFQDLFGMGNQEENIKIIKYRSTLRPVRTPDPHYWGIWDIFIVMMAMEEQNQK